MLFEKKLMPDFTLGSFEELTPSLLKKLGARAVISDIDNTLATYDDLDPPEPVVKWINTLREAEISVTLVSNNRKRRVDRFNSTLCCNAYPNVKKPSIKYIIAAMNDMNSSPDETVFLGDQLLTDSLAAHRAGIRSVIVPPIKDKTSLFFRIKRAIERPYMKKYEKISGRTGKENQE